MVPTLAHLEFQPSTPRATAVTPSAPKTKEPNRIGPRKWTRVTVVTQVATPWINKSIAIPETAIARLKTPWREVECDEEKES